MLAMPGMRGFALTPARGQGGVSCDTDGVFVGDVALLRQSVAGLTNTHWAARPIDELNDELTAL